MKIFALSSILFFTCFFSTSQENLIKLNPEKDFDNISIKKVGGDERSTQFVIWVKDTVRTHRHEKHSESLYVISGEGIFYMNKTKFNIATGDFIMIPEGSWHAVKVTSTKPLKVLSVQSPEFLGEDRTFKNQ